MANNIVLAALGEMEEKLTSQLREVKESIRNIRMEQEPAPRKRKRRKMSAEARKKLSDLQKQRWAERKGKKAPGNGRKGEEA